MTLKEITSGFTYMVYDCPISTKDEQSIVLSECRKCAFFQNMNGEHVECLYDIKEEMVKSV